MNIFSALNEIIFPSRCISCNCLGLSLCADCRRLWNPHIYRSVVGRNSHPSLKVTSSVLYSPTAQKVLLAAKESHLKIADELVSEAITHAVRKVLQESWVDVLIPIPSRTSAARKRGRQFIYEVALPASLETGLPISTPLSHLRKVRDQTGLHLEQRWNNLHGAFVVKSSERPFSSALLVDDLVTTGATLLEAARALRYAGFQVIGAVTAAVAQPVRLSK